MGALPDFVIIGAQKGGTTSLYHLLGQHPLVVPAARKEVHFFDNRFGEGAEWYRQNFPAPEHRDGRPTITGEASPYYLFHPHAPRRLAQTVPRARLIALLRNPVDRAYSHHRMMTSRDQEPLAFEEAVEAEGPRLRGETERMLLDEGYVSLTHQRFSYLSRGVYVDQLRHWSEFFDDEQMLILKSEDFYASPAEGFGRVLAFLGLPAWAPENWAILRKGEYERPMDPETRRRLEEYFKPHNQRLYDYLGRDLGW